MQHVGTFRRQFRPTLRFNLILSLEYRRIDTVVPYVEQRFIAPGTQVNRSSRCLVAGLTSPQEHAVYWTAFFIVIVAEEHFIFRRPGGHLGGYNLDDWDSPSKLPLGVAGILAGCCGVAGAVVGMSEVWYTGPIGKLAGDLYGADLGFELAAGFAAVAFPPLRWVEIRLTGR